MILERDVGPGIHRVGDDHVNFFLIEDGDRVTVVDAGLPKHWASLEAALTTIGRTPDDIDALLLTHGHFDHVGFAERLRRERHVPVYVHPVDFPLLLRPKPFLYRFERLPLLYALHPGGARIMAQMVAAGAFATKPVAKADYFSDGDVLEVAGRPTVITSAGHTHGHVAFHLPERDCLIAGDAVVTLDPYTAKEGPRPVAKAATADSKLMWESLGKLAQLDRAGTVLVGHGPVWKDGIASAVEQARANGQD
jgi:glyoxylase-like metal-dependent hydrolase (beta-lactamase superfamily II)